MSDPRRVFLVRHGATAWSESGRHTGRTDIPLSDLGRDQARTVGELLGRREVSLVLTSPMSRAEETCALVGYGHLAEQDSDLLEWDYGGAEGLTTAQLRETYPGWTVWSGPIPDGETIQQVAERTDRVIQRVLATPGDVVLFSHGHLLRILTARWCELDPTEGKRFALMTGTFCVLGWEHEYRTVELWNHSSAIPEGARD